MPTHIVDVSARSRVFREQPLLSHAWVATPRELLDYLRHPRSELKRLGIRLPANCTIETDLQNHDWLAGHSHGLEDDSIAVFMRGEGDGERFYRVSAYGTKAARNGGRERELLHGTGEEERPANGEIGEGMLLRLDAQRRSMLAAPVHMDVHRWITPLTIDAPTTKSAEESQRIFTGIVGLVEKLVAANPVMAAAMGDVANYLQRSPHPGYLELFQAFRQPATQFHQAFATTMYARATWILQGSGFQREALIQDVAGLLDDPTEPLRILAGAMEALHPDFVAHATVEATIRAQGDALLAERLVEAEHGLTGFAPERNGAFFERAHHLERYAPGDEGEWWYLPGLVAFAMSVWPIEGDAARATQETT